MSRTPESVKGCFLNQIDGFVNMTFCSVVICPSAAEEGKNRRQGFLFSFSLPCFGAGTARRAGEDLFAHKKYVYV